MKKITLEWFQFENNGKTCCRGEKSSTAIHKVISLMEPALRNMKIQLELKEVLLDENRVDLANTVRINGKNIHDVLGEKPSEKSLCPFCSKLTGKDEYCGTYSFSGNILESVSQEMLMEAIVAEIGSPNLLRQDSGSCGCEPEHS